LFCVCFYLFVYGFNFCCLSLCFLFLVFCLVVFEFTIVIWVMGPFSSFLCFFLIEVWKEKKVFFFLCLMLQVWFFVVVKVMWSLKGKKKTFFVSCVACCFFLGWVISFVFLCVFFQFSVFYNSFYNLFFYLVFCAIKKNYFVCFWILKNILDVSLCCCICVLLCILKKLCIFFGFGWVHTNKSHKTYN
jgi:hypothetical protein